MLLYRLGLLAVTVITFCSQQVESQSSSTPSSSSSPSTSNHIAYGNTTVKYYLFIKSSDEPQELKTGDVAGLQRSEYDVSKQTMVVVHGWTSNITSPNIRVIVHAALEYLDVNTIGVDWGYYAGNINYFQDVSELPFVGTVLTDFINFLIEQGTSPNNVYMVGHSLGAHLVGVTGRMLIRFDHKVGRITGLDPASFVVRERLTKTDAQFVDVIHTDGGLAGLDFSLGMADYYPNGGVPIQPGCFTLDFNGCSHHRSYVFFAESIDSKHRFYACKCQAVVKGIPFGCSSNCTALMGYFASPRDTGNFYLTTNSEPPYAKTVEQ